MEIHLLSPTNNSTVDIIPKNQNEIMLSLPKENIIIPNGFDWRNPLTGAHKDDDQSKPQRIIFTWALEGNLSELTDLTLLLSSDEEFSNPYKYDILPGQMFLSITNFKRNHMYYWKMVGYCEEDIISESELFCFKTGADLPQWYSIRGTSNVRDIGGWKTLDGKTVVCGKIIRGGELNRGLVAESDALEFLRRALHIKTDLDMRYETDYSGFSKSPIPDARWVKMPILAYLSDISDTTKENFRQLFSFLADENNYPIYLHCVAGADRTGTAVALILAILGVSLETIAYEYELTSMSIFGPRSSHQQWFANMLIELSRYGKNINECCENFLLSCGVTAQEIDKIRSILLN